MWMKALWASAVVAQAGATTPPSENDASALPTGDTSSVTGWDLGAQGLDARSAPVEADDPECDRLFGTEEDRESNEEARGRRLILVEEGPSYIDVVQTGGWTEPAEIDFRGLNLVGTESTDEGDVAVIEVNDELGFCEPGEYEVEVDDSLGSRGRILAILPDLLLVEWGDELRYLRGARYRGRPSFKVSWRSPFSVVVESEKSGRPTKRTARRRRRRR